jgi:hypothetical protein
MKSSDASMSAGMVANKMKRGSSAHRSTSHGRPVDVTSPLGSDSDSRLTCVENNQSVFRETVCRSIAKLMGYRGLPAYSSIYQPGIDFSVPIQPVHSSH